MRAVPPHVKERRHGQVEVMPCRAPEAYRKRFDTATAFLAHWPGVPVDALRTGPRRRPPSITDDLEAEPVTAAKRRRVTRALHTEAAKIRETGEV